MEILKKEVKTLNKTSGYIQMPLKYLGKEFLIMSQEDFDFLIGNKNKDGE